MMSLALAIVYFTKTTLEVITFPYFILTLIYGACVGSFLNVVVYRLPLGKSLVMPPSSCPKCGHKLAWYDNVPVFGWLWLRGKCRYCANPISPQYPILEGFCALAFGMLFLAYFHTYDRLDFFTLRGSDTAMVFVLHLFLLGGLIAASKIDANLFIIPLEICWTVTIVALVGFPIAAEMFPSSARLMPHAPTWGIGAAMGGTIGLAIAFMMLRKGILPVSFLDPQAVAEMEKMKRQKEEKGKSKRQTKKEMKAREEREKGAAKEGSATPKAAEGAKPVASHAPAPISAKSKALYLLLITAIAIALWFTLGLWGRVTGFVLLWWGVLLVDFGAYGDAADFKDSGPEHWWIHPRPRFEAMKEVLYLSFPIVFALIGIGIATLPAVEPSLLQLPLPVKALAGVVFGYLVGCGVVWGVRILGTLGFGKEAMGLGDVHLVGAIGAVIGAGDATISFLLAAFLGLGHAVVEATLGRLLVKRGVQIPYGPHLCGAAILLMLFRTPIAKIAEESLGLPIFGR